MNDKLSRKYREIHPCALHQKSAANLRCGSSAHDFRIFPGKKLQLDALKKRRMEVKFSRKFRDFSENVEFSTTSANFFLDFLVNLTHNYLALNLISKKIGFCRFFFLEIRERLYQHFDLLK